jgi:IMP dehydrogenase
LSDSLPKLISEEEAAERAEALRKTYSILYETSFKKVLGQVPVEMVLPTEDCLEADKLVATVKAFLYENYRVPTICLELPNKRVYVIDGHHRLLVHKLFKENVMNSYILSPEGEIEYYKPVRSIMDLSIINMPLSRTNIPFLTAVKIVLYYRRIYGDVFHLEHRNVDVLSLIPTQSSISVEGLEYWRDEYSPITCLEYLNKLYILDGHTRAFAKMLKGEHSAEALVIKSGVSLDLKIVETAGKLGLSSIKDVKIIDAMP